MKTDKTSYLSIVSGYFRLLNDAPSWTDEEEAAIENQFWTEIQQAPPPHEPPRSISAVLWRCDRPSPDVVPPVTPPSTMKGALMLVEACEARFIGGQQQALFDALEAWATFDIPMPDWVRREFLLRYRIYNEFHAANLGEAFGITRPKGKSIATARKKQKLFPLLYMAVHYRWEFFRESTGNGKNSLWPRIAKHFHISEGSAKRYYWEDMTSEQKDEFHYYWKAWKAARGLQDSGRTSGISVPKSKRRARTNPKGRKPQNFV